MNAHLYGSVKTTDGDKGKMWMAFNCIYNACVPFQDTVQGACVFTPQKEITIV
jgi:hypothetical protein